MSKRYLCKGAKPKPKLDQDGNVQVDYTQFFCNIIGMKITNSFCLTIFLLLWPIVFFVSAVSVLAVLDAVGVVEFFQYLENLRCYWLANPEIQHLTAIYIAVLFFFPLLFIVWCQKIVKEHQTEWWAPNKNTIYEDSWENVRSIINDDPLEFSKDIPWPRLKEHVLDSILFVAGMVGYYLFVIWKVKGFSCFVQSISFSSENGSSLALTVGLLTAIVGALVIFLQFRSDVRSKNRQNWINDLRASTIDVIDNLPSRDELPAYQKDSSLSQNKIKKTKYMMRERESVCTKAMWKLELLLNPNEKDHRTLITIARMLAYPFYYQGGQNETIEDWLNADEENIQEGKKNKNILLDIDRKVLKNIPDLLKSKPFNSHSRDELLTYTVRIFQAVLKKEWERVKQGK